MANTKYTQVYRPDGSWFAFFYTPAAAQAWVKRQPDADKFEITERRPEKKPR